MLLYWIYPIGFLAIFHNGVKYTIEKTEWQARSDTPERQATLKTSQRTKQKPTENQKSEQHGSHEPMYSQKISSSGCFL
jgi:hypothetical protein